MELAALAKILDSIPPSDQHWLLVTWSVDFANVGPTLAIGRIISRFFQHWANVGPTVACQLQLRLDVSIFCPRWANVGQMVDFYSRWQQAIIGDFVTFSEKLFIMVCIKIIFQ